MTVVQFPLTPKAFSNIISRKSIFYHVRKGLSVDVASLVGVVSGVLLIVIAILLGGDVHNNNYKAGDSLPITFDLPGEHVTVSGRIEIIGIDGQGVCHCRFLDLTNDLINAIHRYVLAVQKQVVRMRRDSLRKISHPGDMADQDEALEDLLRENLGDAAGLSIPKSFAPD